VNYNTTIIGANRLNIKEIAKHAILACLAAASLRQAMAKDLLQVYDDAVLNDQTLQAADATRMAAREASPQALAALLPQVSGNWAIQRTASDTGTAEPFPNPSDPSQVIAIPIGAQSWEDQRGYNLQLSQTVFSWSQWKSLSRAHKQVAQAEADYKAAQEDLIQRLATAYFNVLSAKDTLDADQAALDAYTQQLEQANKRYDVGLIPITDVKEAQAAHDSSAADVITAKRQLASMEQALREITYRDYDALAAPGDSMPLNPPTPADPEQWVQTSMDQNLTLLSRRLAADIARDAVEVARAGHYPSISLQASRAKSTNDTNEDFTFGGPPESARFPGSQTTNQIELEVTVPIFSGGATQSQVRQAQYQWIAAKDQMQVTSRQTEHAARDAYTGVISDIARVAALRQGLISAQVALQATQAGYNVGTRTEVEVLNSRQSLVAAQTTYLQSRYTYINDYIALKLAAGTLNRATVEEINRWLVTTESLHGTSPPPALGQ